MSWRLAKSLDKLRYQINTLFPNRDRDSDGSIGDERHQKAGTSDHLPNAAGVVTALDIDADLSPTENVRVLVKALQASRDPRIKYIIYERRITVKGDVSKWKRYNGPSPHDHHFHISVSSDRGLYDDATDWNLDLNAVPATPTSNVRMPILKRGDKGPLVKLVQEKLNGFRFNLTVDGDYGQQTYDAVVRFQRSKDIYIDGRVGPETRKELGL